MGLGMKFAQEFLLAGSGQAYVWDVYNITDEYELSAQTGESTMIAMFSSTTIRYSSNAPTINPSTGVISLPNYSTTTGPPSTAQAAGAFNAYWMSAAQNRAFYKTSLIGQDAVRPQIRYDPVANQVKGSATGTTVESSNINAYPADGPQGNYWYVLRT